MVGVEGLEPPPACSQSMPSAADLHSDCQPVFEVATLDLTSGHDSRWQLPVGPRLLGPGDTIRTCDPSAPNGVLYAG